METIYALLGVSFPEKEEPVSRDSLTPDQKQVLEAILAVPDLWNEEYASIWPAEIFGLPKNRSGLEALLRSG